MFQFQPSSSGCGYLYIANTPSYVSEALGSYNSLRRFMPDASVSFISHPEMFTHTPGIDWIPLVGKYDSPIVKVEAVRSPYEKTILLDTDTRIIGDVSPVFELLDRFDIAAAHEPTRGWDYPTKAARAFCELNTGVVAFRKSESMARFFEMWRQTYDVMRQNSGLINDQPAFREALWCNEEIRVATLPTEFHLITGKACGIAWEACVLHGRNDLNALEKIINRHLGPRAYVPDYGVITPYLGRLSVLRNWLDITNNALRTFLIKKRDRPTPGDWQLRATAKKSPTKGSPNI